jgi:hypothetical protein
LPEGWIPTYPDPQTAGWDSLITSQNPLNVICGYGYTFQYQAVFVPTAPSTPVGSAVVVVLDAIGGSINPGPGRYTFAEGSSHTMTATADEGYEFLYWIATGTGSTAGHEKTIILDNPLTIKCGIGYTYEYQPVFIPQGAETQPSGTPVEYFYAAIIILAIIAVIGIAAALMYRSRGGAK